MPPLTSNGVGLRPGSAEGWASTIAAAAARPLRAGDLSGLEKLLDVVMEELVKLDVTDPSIGGTLSDGDIEFSLAVEDETLEKATASVFGTIRTAIHAAGGGTPGWPGYPGEGVTAQLVDA